MRIISLAVVSFEFYSLERTQLQLNTLANLKSFTTAIG